MVTYCILGLVYVLACLADSRFFKSPGKHDTQRGDYAVFGVSCAVCGLIGPLTQGVCILTMLGCRWYARKLAREQQAHDVRMDKLIADWNLAWEKMMESLTRGVY